MKACLHPIVFDEQLFYVHRDSAWSRECALCGLAYARSDRILTPLREAIRDRYRLPRSPWTATERAFDC